MKLILLLVIVLIQLQYASAWIPSRRRQQNVCSYKVEVRCGFKGYFRKKACYTTKRKCCPDWDVEIPGSSLPLLNCSPYSAHCRYMIKILKLRVFKRYGCRKKVTCISLPQNTPSKCKVERREQLEKAREVYYLTKPPKEMPSYPVTSDNLLDFITLPVLNKTSEELFGLNLNSTRNAQWALTYNEMAKRTKKHAEDVAFDPIPITTYLQYAELLDGFRKVLHDGTPFEKYFTYPSQEGNFKDIIANDDWQDDQVFVEQRLAGLNPILIRKLRYEDFLENFSEFSLDLDAAIVDVVGAGKTMEEMVQEKLVFILDFPLVHNLTNVPDITDFNRTDRREMRSSRSPVAIFVSVENPQSKKFELKPVAIQTDLDSAAPVYTPKDGLKWLLAKEEVQRADSQHTQIIEHLLKTHLLMEPICVTTQRTLSKLHPLHDMLKWHCRGTLLVNNLGIPTLFNPGSLAHAMFAIGHVGALELLNKGYEKLTWDDMDFEEDLKKRGVDDTLSLPYFPFRDDGIVVWRVVKHFAKGYVNLYYKSTNSILNDNELQNFANELSADGTGQFGGVGMVKKFPAKFTSISQLVDTLARIIFLPIQHHAVNYPVAYYGGFVPNMPGKLYDDPREVPEEFGIYNLPNRFLATQQVALAMNLGSLRYDRLFDYGSSLTDTTAGHLVKNHFTFLNKFVKVILEKRNKRRLADGHLSYPYFLPGLIPNSIHA